MKKYFSALLVIVIGTLCYLIIASANIVFDDEYAVPKTYKNQVEKYRLVLLTKDIDTTFWETVATSAEKTANKANASLEVWGSYSNNTEEFLEKLELAIHSKVDGIIIQGVDSDEFKELTKVKASFNGIPIITIANDVPMESSLRRTYIGSNQYEAGELIATQLVADMGEVGEVVLLFDQEEEFYQQERLKGILHILNKYPSIVVKEAPTTEQREQVVNTVRSQLNLSPNIDAFISINSNMVGGLVDEIKERFQVAPYYIYTFDEGADSYPLLEIEEIDGVIQQDPEQMGEMSVKQLIKWLEGDSEPLNIDGYYTNIRILKGEAND